MEDRYGILELFDESFFYARGKLVGKNCFLFNMQPVFLCTVVTLRLQEILVLLQSKNLSCVSLGT